MRAIEKVLITGGAGFIGLHLAKELLAAGYSVHLVDNCSRGVVDNELELFLRKKNTYFYNLNCLDHMAVSSLPRDFTYIFHLAAIIGVSHVEERPRDVITENIKMLEILLDLAERQERLKRFLFASTSEVYAGTLENFALSIPTPETTPLAITDLKRPRTSYMLSKICGEALCHYCSVPFTIFRPHNIYGPRMGMSHVVPEQLLKSYKSPEAIEIPVASAFQTRTFCYIDDAVRMLVRIMESDKCVGLTLNLGNQEPEVTIQQLANLCYEIVGRNHKVLTLPAVSGSPQRRCPDMTHTLALIDFIPSISLYEGVQRTYHWYLENVFNCRGISAR